MICPRCKGNGYFRVLENKTPYSKRDIVVQCPMCKSQGEIKMSLLIMIIVVLTLTNCSKVDKKFDKLYWDPIKGMFRITYGIVK